MRRTTIFRSELTVIAAALGFPLAAAAQQPPAIQRPIQQAQRTQQQPQGAAQNPAAAAQRPAPSAQQNQPSPPSRGGVTITSGAGGAFPQGASAPPATHVVAQGETLWSLARQFLGDPLLWPEIYRLNTTTVEDPHWIYPGEELRLTAEGADQPTSAVVSQAYTVSPTGDTTRQAPAPAPSAGLPTTGPTIFSQQTSRAATAPSIEQMGARSYRAVRDGEYYSAGFLTENQPLSTGRIVASLRMATQVRVRGTANLYDVVIVAAPGAEALEPGDMLLTFRRGDEVGDWGQMVIPTGLLRVEGPEGDRYAARVVRVYGSISDDQEVLRIQPFAMNTNQRPEPVTDGVTGRVIRMRDPHEVAQRLAVLFIDKGANDGVKLGDLFQIYLLRPDPEHGGALEQDQARAIVVNTRSATSTAIIVELYRGDVGPQSSARLIRRMPS